MNGNTIHEMMAEADRSRLKWERMSAEDLRDDADLQALMNYYGGRGAGIAWALQQLGVEYRYEGWRAE